MWLLLGTLVLAYFIYRWICKWRAKQAMVCELNERGIPFAPTPSSIGAIIRGIQFYDVIEKAIGRYGRVFGLSRGDHKTTIVLAHPELAQIVLSKEFTHFANRPKFPIKSDIFNQFLFFTDVETWKRLRSIVSPTFSGAKMRLMKPLIDHTTRTLLRNLDHLHRQTNIIDMKTLAGTFTMDSIVKIAFGIEVDSHNDTENELVRQAKRFFTTGLNWSLMVIVLVGSFFPFLTKIKIPFVRFNHNSVLFFYDSAKAIIEAKRKEYRSRQSVEFGKANNFIELMLEAEAQGEITVQGSVDSTSSKYITHDEMLAQCVLFFLAGYDTTATTISLTCYNLARYPETQEKLFTEIENVLKRLGLESETTTDPVKLVTLDTIQRFEYLNGAVNETLRLYPPLINLDRVASSDMRLETSDRELSVEIRRGDGIVIPVYSLHHDPQQFADPSTFRPERFLGEPTHHKYAHLPFGSGPRNCIANRLALLEAKIAVLHIVRNYRLEVCTETPIPLKFPNKINQLSPDKLFLKCQPRL